MASSTRAIWEWSEVLEGLPPAWDWDTMGIPDDRDTSLRTGDFDHQSPGSYSESSHLKLKLAVANATLTTPQSDERPPLSSTPSSKGEYIGSAKLLISLSQQFKERFMNGYTKDPFFRDKWKKAGSLNVSPFDGQCFFRDEESLLFFHSEDNVARLCIPRAETAGIIAWAHDSPFEAAHKGPHKLALRLSSKFYWPRLRAEVMSYVSSCDVCQKVKHDT
ncbi:hypothetical protein SCP_0112390 [Sparassis crispa]|uniref:Integrase zinc-binding domain-containing protein n=1 Tax=Sparassis crispa TaxID=139825 RepID=A0A401G863_9APHY|nr:hypothetical protein SCP_0112390 [Sparassis crispa]GBE78354.1 hypothetical protein SCP_0112390 [Sparassis crispa]